MMDAYEAISEMRQCYACDKNRACCETCPYRPKFYYYDLAVLVDELAGLNMVYRERISKLDDKIEQLEKKSRSKRAKTKQINS